jgi:hypothetical protein
LNFPTSSAQIGCVDEEVDDEHVVEGDEMKRCGAKVMSERRLARELASRSARRL